MNIDLLQFLLLLIITLMMYIMPFYPAILEWKNKTDVNAPRINFQDRTIVDYCIRIFKEYIDTNFSALIKQYRNLDVTHEGKDRNGSDYLINGKKGLLPLSNEELGNKKTNRVIILFKSGVLPNEIQFTNKIYATGSVEIGAFCKIKELMAEGDIDLNAGVHTQNLLYSDKTITVNNDCNLQKYVNAKLKIHFRGQSQFQYLHAPVITFGPTKVELPDSILDVISAELPREVIQKRLVIPENSDIASHFVVKESLLINSGSRIQGNIKCYGDVYIKEGTVIMGSLFCMKDLYISNNCIIQGPVVSSGTIRIGEDCVIGSHKSMTTVIAENIIITDGCLISGLVLAKMEGKFIEA